MVGRSIVVPAGTRSVLLTLEPEAPAAHAVLPRKVSIIGNVYSIRAALQPSGNPVSSLAKTAVVTLVYPALAGPHQTHEILASTDGTRFTELSSTDSPVLQQITAHTRSFGFFAVGVHRTSGGTPTPAGGSGFPVTTVVVAAAAVAALTIGWLRWRVRRIAAARAARSPTRAGGVKGKEGGERRRSGPPPRRRRRPGSSRDDWWR